MSPKKAQLALLKRTIHRNIHSRDNSRLTSLSTSLFLIFSFLSYFFFPLANPNSMQISIFYPFEAVGPIPRRVQYLINFNCGDGDVEIASEKFSKAILQV